MIIEQAKEVLQIEAHSIEALTDRIGKEFKDAVDLILNAKGRVILTGMGKSGLIGRKIAATLNSTGTPAMFLHPAEAIHGDLGMVTKNDIIIAISNSGMTSEINNLLPIIRKMGTKIISFTGGRQSRMANLSDIVIDVGVEREACPMGLAPTASTTAALAMGDALAVVLINCRSFDSEDFRRFHPGGSLGERLSIRIKEVMQTGDRVPIVDIGSSALDAIREMEKKGIGATLVTSGDRRLEGIITDGDIRRLLAREASIYKMGLREIMTPSPRTIGENQTTAEALGVMELYKITLLAIVDQSMRILGVVHLHDLLGGEDFKINGCT